DLYNTGLKNLENLIQPKIIGSRTTALLCVDGTLIFTGGGDITAVTITFEFDLGGGTWVPLVSIPAYVVANGTAYFYRPFPVSPSFAQTHLTVQHNTSDARVLSVG